MGLDAPDRVLALVLGSEEEKQAARKALREMACRESKKISEAPKSGQRLSRKPRFWLR